MPSRSSTKPRSGCPISLALEILGDTWSLLIVRDLMFRGRRTFNEFLNAGEGIASNVLADRLSRLEKAGIVSKRRDVEDARRFLYRLTPKGIDLAPAMVELVQWTARYEKTDAPPRVVRALRRNREGFLAQIRATWAEANE
jgi:DNA-binding HxlR family transcriptional regulator